MTIRIRGFSMEDYEEVISLWQKTNLSYKPYGRDQRERIEKEMKQGNAIFLVAEDNDKVVASVLGTHDGRKGWINRLAVLTEYRNKGLAKKLVQEAEKRLHEIGIDIIACLIESENQDSLAVFTKLGYNEFPGMHYLTKRKYPEV